MRNRLLNYVLYHYLKKIKGKTFIIFNVFLIISSLLVSQLPTIMKGINIVFDYEEVIVIIDHTNNYGEQFKDDLTLINEELVVQFSDEVTSDLTADVESGDVSGYFELSYNDSHLLEANYVIYDYTNVSLAMSAEQFLGSYNQSLVLSTANLTDEQLSLLNAPFSLDVIMLDEGALTEEEVFNNFAIAYFAIILIFMFSYTYAAYAGQEVMYEKTSRIMEIVVSSISPTKQLYGKIIYNSLYALTQLTILILLATIGISQALDGFSDTFDLSDITISPELYEMILYFILFAIVGYLIYLIGVLLLSSIITSIEEYQIAISPIMIIGVVSFYIGIFGMSFVDSPFIKIMSYLPFFSVYIMPLRIAAGTASTIEIWLSLGINLAIFILLVRFGANVYKNGVLNYSSDSVISKFKRSLGRS